MKIRTDDRRCGAGKTFEALGRAVATPSKTLFVMDRTHLMSTRLKEIQGWVNIHGTSPVVPAPIHHKSTPRSVAREIESLPQTYEAYDHVIVIATSSGMMISEFSQAFKDWNIVMDEDINPFIAQEWKLTANLEHVQDNYILEQVSKDTYRVKPKPDCKTLAQYRQDSTLSTAMIDFRRVLDHQLVYTNKPVFEKTCEWWSIWDFRTLANFKTVTILANAFREKLSYKLACLNGQVEFEDLCVDDTRVWAPRPITIRYFASDHRAAKTSFTTPVGHQNTLAVMAWVDQHFEGRPCFWTTNSNAVHALPESETDHRYIQPMATGRNDLVDFTACFAMYAAKASPTEADILSAISGGLYGYPDIHRDRELETLAQFVLRGSLRDPDDTRPYEIIVYDHEQAAFVKDFLVRNKYAEAQDVKVVHVGSIVRKTTKDKPPKEPKADPTPEEIIAKREWERVRKAEQRAKNKAK